MKHRSPTPSPRPRHAALAALLVLLLSACASAPETGRSQLILVSAQQELQMGVSQFRQLKQDTPISDDGRLQALVRRVGERIARVAPLPNARWEFVVFDDPKQANAFCLPGGKVGVYSGILPYTRDEAGLATVIGHEVGHAVAYHGAERVSHQLAAQFGAQVVGQVAGAYAPGAQQAIMAAYDVGSQVGILLPYSRTQELEADHLGLLYMARAGYDPRAARAFWLRFAAAHDRSAPAFEFISTHPLDRTRIARLDEVLPRALGEYQLAVDRP